MDDPTHGTSLQGVVMGLFGHHHRLSETTNRVPGQPQLLWKNFNICPHCRRRGRPCIVESLYKDGPVITRSDGETFHLILGDRPISFPDAKPARRIALMTAGFWYVHESLGQFTRTVVVMLRRPPRGGVALQRHLEIVADRLADKLSTPEDFESVYDFSRNRLHRVS